MLKYDDARPHTHTHTTHTDNVARFAEPRTLLQKDKALKAALSQLEDRYDASPLPPPVQSAVEAAKLELQS